MARSTRSAVLVAAALGAVAAGGCYAHFSGGVAVDGAPFAPVECHSGQAYGGPGVELSDLTGCRLRLATSLDGTAVAALFRPGMAAGELVGPCGVITMRSQNSRINGITNMQGFANLSCQSAGHQITGQIQFENCH